MLFVALALRIDGYSMIESTAAGAALSTLAVGVVDVGWARRDMDKLVPRNEIASQLLACTGTISSILSLTVQTPLTISDAHESGIAPFSRSQLDSNVMHPDFVDHARACSRMGLVATSARQPLLIGYSHILPHVRSRKRNLFAILAYNILTLCFSRTVSRKSGDSSVAHNWSEFSRAIRHRNSNLCGFQT